MVLEFLSNIDVLLVLVAFVVFIVFILSIKQVIKTTQNFTNMVVRKIRTLAIVVIAAAIFPIVANRLLGLAVNADLPTIKIFALGGVALYALYLLGSGIYKGLSVLERHTPSLPKKDKGYDKLAKTEKQHSKKLGELQKRIDEGKKKLKEDNTLVSDGDIVKYNKKREKDAQSASGRTKKHITPLREINYEELEEKD